MIYQKYTRLCGFLVLLILLAVTTSPVLACTQSPPTPWFDERLDVVSSNLPDGIQLSDLENGIALQNKANAIIYMKDEQGNLQKITDKYLRISLNVSYDQPANEILQVEGDTYYNLPLKPYNVFADNRPANVIIPEPQTVDVDIWVGQQVYTLQIKISYRLSSDYYYKSVDMYENGCARFNWMNGPLNLIASGIVIFFVVLLLIGIVFRERPNHEKGMK